MTTGPDVSVVVPTHNRCRLLPRLVECLAADQGVKSFELIVVDDGSVDATSATLDELSTKATFPMRVVRRPVASGAAAARNVGWRLATAPVVAFTDDDCRPQPGWLGRLLREFDDADIVQGRTTFDPADGVGRGPFSQVVAVETFSGNFETSNIAYRRDLLAAVDGFDEEFGGDSFGEDVDLGWRAIEHGARTAFAADAVVIHDIKRGPGLSELRASIRDARRWRHIGRVLHDHPPYRAYRLHRDPFLAPTHPPTLAALLGLGLLARFGPRRFRGAVGVGLVIPWLVHRLTIEVRPGSLRNRVAVLPAAFVVDATETLTVVMSGIRHRTLVL